MAKQISPDFDVSKYASIPSASNQSPWYGIIRLREYLQSHGRLSETFLLLEVDELCHSEKTVKVEIIRSFLAGCIPKFTTQPIWWLSGKARLRLVLVLGLLGNAEESRLEVERAKVLFCHGLQKGKQENLLLEVQNTMLKLRQNEDETTRLQNWTSFANSALAAHDWFMESNALQEAASIASSLYEKQQTDMSRETFLSLQSRSEALLERLGDAYFLLLGHMLVDGEAISRGDFSSVLQWQEEFARKYPNFQLWQPQIVIRQRNVAVYTILGDHERAFANLAAANRIIKECETFWQEDETLVSQVSGSSLPGNNGILDADDDEQSDEEDWFREWSQDVYVGHPQLPPSQRLTAHLGAKTIGNRLSFWATLLRWIRNDYKRGELTESAVVSILMPEPGSVTEKDSQDFLMHMHPENLLTRLLGSDGAPVPTEQWTKSFESLSSWFLNSTLTTRSSDITSSSLCKTSDSTHLSRLMKKHRSWSLKG